IVGEAAERRSGPESDDRFAAAPNNGAERVTGRKNGAETIAGHSAHAPRPASARGRGPRHDIGRMIERHADEPAVIGAAVARVAAIGSIDTPAHECQGAPLILDDRGENCSSRFGSYVQIDWPAAVR